VHQIAFPNSIKEGRKLPFLLGSVEKALPHLENKQHSNMCQNPVGCLVLGADCKLEIRVRVGGLE
jgi:hypothetical protein